MASFTLSQLREVFHLPIKEAIEKLECSKKTFKQACINNNILTWPNNQVRALSKIMMIYFYLLSTNIVENKKRKYLEKLSQITSAYQELMETGIVNKSLSEDIISLHKSFVSRHIRTKKFQDFIGTTTIDINLTKEVPKSNNNKMDINFILN